MIGDRRGPDRGTGWRRVWRGLELLAGLGLWALLAALEPALILVRTNLVAMRGAAGALPSLLVVDGAGTAANAALMIGRVAIALVPTAFLLRASPRTRWPLLLAPLIVLCLMTAPVSLGSCATPSRWALLVALSGLASALVRWPLLAPAAALPFLVLLEAAPGHLRDRRDLATRAQRERRLAECARHDGVRPIGLTADHLHPYHGITQYSDDLLLLTDQSPSDGDGDGLDYGDHHVGSWWVERRGGRLALERPSRAHGNLWRGCVLEGVVWMARANMLVGARRVSRDGASYESVTNVNVPSGDMDFGETACEPEGRRVYITEATGGGLWRFELDGGRFQRFELGGVVLLPERRFDGMIVVRDTSRLMVFDPATERVVERVPAALASAGFDVCDRDGSVAMADLAGRVRVFRLDARRRYRLDWAVGLFAPRRVAFSRDCSRLGVTSADDRTVTLFDARTHHVVGRHAAGPALREIAATGERELTVTDSCSATTYSW